MTNTVKAKAWVDHTFPSSRVFLENYRKKQEEPDNSILSNVLKETADLQKLQEKHYNRSWRYVTPNETDGWIVSGLKIVGNILFAEIPIIVALIVDRVTKGSMPTLKQTLESRNVEKQTTAEGFPIGSLLNTIETEKNLRIGSGDMSTAMDFLRQDVYLNGKSLRDVTWESFRSNQFESMLVTLDSDLHSLGGDHADYPNKYAYRLTFCAYSDCSTYAEYADKFEGAKKELVELQNELAEIPESEDSKPTLELIQQTKNLIEAGGAIGAKLEEIVKNKTLPDLYEHLVEKYDSPTRALEVINLLRQAISNTIMYDVYTQLKLQDISDGLGPEWISEFVFASVKKKGFEEFLNGGIKAKDEELLYIKNGLKKLYALDSFSAVHEVAVQAQNNPDKASEGIVKAYRLLEAELMVADPFVRGMSLPTDPVDLTVYKIDTRKDTVTVETDFFLNSTGKEVKKGLKKITIGAKQYATIGSKFVVDINKMQSRQRYKVFLNKDVIPDLQLPEGSGSETKRRYNREMNSQIRRLEVLWKKYI